MHKLASPALESANQSGLPLRAHAPRPRQYGSQTYFGNQAALRFSRTAPRIQTKLQVGATNDPLEAEADQVADRVMRMTDSSITAGDSSPVVRRLCPECKKEDEEKQQSVQRKTATVGNSGGPAPQSVDQVLNSPGRPLAAPDRAFFEPRFGADLSHVRVHTDAHAQESAQSVNALAYTFGRHIVFGPGQFSPQSQQGRRLLAHELTHTLQQSSGGGSARRSLQRTGLDTSATPAADTNQPEQSSVKKQSDSREVKRAEAKSGALGDSLPSPVRKQMESRFGMDLSAVPVHTDAAAAKEASSIGARAFTRDRELYFAQGRYNPNSSSGQALIAHELTHVAQQRQGCAHLKGNLADIRKLAAANSSLEGEASANAAGFLESKDQMAVSNNAAGVVRRSAPGDNAPAADTAVADPAAVNPAVADPAAKDPAATAPAVVNADQNGPAPASTMGDILDAVKAAAKGGLQAVADFIAEKFAATDALIGQLNNLRKAILSAGKSVVLSQGTVAQAASIYNAVASYIPSWLPAPEIRFGPVQPFIIIIAGVALGAAELALILAFFLCMIWLLLRTNPGIRKGQDKAIQDLIDKINEDLKPKEEETPKKDPDKDPKKGPDDPPPPLPGPPDACFANMGLIPDASGSRWAKQRAPITKDGQTHITVSDAAFRLDKGFQPPAGQDASPAASKWARSIGMPEDDAGHVIANRLGGTTDFNGPNGNIFPQDLSQNRGGMRVLDDLVKKKHDAGCDVCVHIGLLYESNTDLRPNSTTYTVQSRCDGGFDPPITTQIPNETAKRPAP